MPGSGRRRKRCYRCCSTDSPAAHGMVRGGADIPLQPMEDPAREQVDASKEGSVSLEYPDQASGRTSGRTCAVRAHTAAGCFWVTATYGRLQPDWRSLWRSLPRERFHAEGEEEWEKEGQVERCDKLPETPIPWALALPGEQVEPNQEWCCTWEERMVGGSCFKV